MPAKKDEVKELSVKEQFVAFIESLVGNSTITADVAGIIKHAIEAKFK